jgi:hypothetical protein
LFTADYLAKNKTDVKFAPVRTAMSDNSVAIWKTTIPTMLFHGLDDTFVPKGVSEKTYQDFIKIGVSGDLIKYIPYAGLDHGSALLPTELTTINWFLDLKNKK